MLRRPRRLLVTIAAALTLSVLAQEEPPPAPGEAQPAGMQVEQLEALRDEINQVLEQLVARADEAERAEIEALREEFNRLFGELMADLEQQMGELEPWLQIEGEAPAERGIVMEAHTRLSEMRESLEADGDLAASADELAEIRMDLENAFEGAEEAIQERWAGLRERFQGFEERLRAEEQIGAEEWDAFLRDLEDLALEPQLDTAP
jgi:uncharacterized membrane protein